jgi:hypothetical protein
MHTGHRPGPGIRWTSDLAVDEFTALREVGFDPVGQVAGSVVRNLSWWYKGEAPGLRSMAMSDPLMTPDKNLMVVQAGLMAR